MIAIALAITPIFIVIALGWIARATSAVPRELWPGVNRLAYWAFFPSLVFTNIARADFVALDGGRFMIAAAGGFATMAVVVIALKPFLRGVSGPQFTSLLQGSIRWNGVVLVAAVESIFGPEAVALAALVFAPVTLLVNIICVGALSVWGEGAAPSWPSFFKRLASNPLILACLLGGIANATGVFTEGPAIRALDLLADAAVGGGLMGIGAGLDLKALRAGIGVLSLSIAIKLLALPAVLWGWAHAMGLDPLATTVLVGAGATPGAAASYVLARELGGDAELVAGHVTATVLLSAITLPLWLAALAPG